jgi:ABC-type lipoprotein export system ATPase subunit
VSAPAVVACEGVVHIYPTPTEDVVALRGVDLQIAAGSRVALVGPSGCGKSTLLAVMAGLVRPSAGRVLVGTTDVVRASERELVELRAGGVGVVLQGAAGNLLGYVDALDNVRFARAGARTASRPAGPGGAQLPAGDLLAALGLQGLAGVPVGRLSGGEQQRVAIAVALANGPGLLLADEPTSQLDAAARDDVVQALVHANTALGTTVVAVTHDPAVGAALGRVVAMRDGRVGAEGRGHAEYAVVGTDGAVHLPEHLLEAWPPGSLVRVVEEPDDPDRLSLERGPR